MSYTVSLIIPDFEVATSPREAVEHFIDDVTDNFRVWAYIVTDDDTGRRWQVDMAQNPPTVKEIHR